MTPRQTRALRGAGAAFAATIVAATAHTLAGDGAPPPLLVVAIAVLASPVAVLLAGRQVSPWRIGATVVLSQALFHVAFALTASADPSAIGHTHHIPADLMTAPISTAGLLPSGWMMLGHALAATLTMVALYRGERMLHALGRGIRRLLGLGSSAGLIPVLAAAPVAPGQRRAAPHHRIPLSDLSRRGPPAFVVAAG